VNSDDLDRVTFKVTHLLRLAKYDFSYTAVQQLTRFQLTQHVARFLCGSGASCDLVIVILLAFCWYSFAALCVDVARWKWVLQCMGHETRWTMNSVLTRWSGHFRCLSPDPSVVTTLSQLTDDKSSAHMCLTLQRISSSSSSSFYWSIINKFMNRPLSAAFSRRRRLFDRLAAAADKKIGVAG